MNCIMEKIIISIVSNIAFEPHFTPLLNKIFNENDIDVKAQPIPFEEYSSMKYKQQIKNSTLNAVWLNLETLFPDVLNEILLNKSEQALIDEILFLCKKTFANINTITNAPIIWFLFEDYFTQNVMITGHTPFYKDLINKINTKLLEILNEKILIIDLKRLIAEVGISNAYDPKGKYRWNAPYSKSLVETAIKEIHKQYLIEKGLSKKCLVLDCDNVLWGGVFSEDGIENLKIGVSGFGHAYQDFQRFLLSLYYHGVILTICSKNNLADVMTMFHEHSEMILKEEHIACFQVNWDNKPENIKQIAQTLNIDLNSIVFIDDSPIEVEAVRAMLPQVETILYERDTVYKKLSCFNLKGNINQDDVEKRNETYRTNQSREVLKSGYTNYKDYIDALKIKLDIHKAVPIEFSRISELTQRTNKCTNGKRYTVAEIKEKVNIDNVTLYSLSASDKYSDLGIVGTFAIKGDTLILFSLSCRALGREIEEKMLIHIAEKHKINKIDFRLTGQNEDVKIFLLKAFPNSTLTN